jgi:tRNA nucleotidyltransferase (CCA-adding enzyme)
MSPSVPVLTDIVMNPSAAATAVDLTARPNTGWELFPHDADIGVRGFGPTIEVAFEQAALALTAAVTDPRAVAPRKLVEIACEARDSEFLFVEWLNALVYEMATRHMLFGRFVVHVGGRRLRAWAWGEPVDVARHEPATEVKGATFTALKVAPRAGGGWIAQCVVDV